MSEWIERLTGRVQIFAREAIIRVRGSAARPLTVEYRYLSQRARPGDRCTPARRGTPGHDIADCIARFTAQKPGSHQGIRLFGQPRHDERPAREQNHRDAYALRPSAFENGFRKRTLLPGEVGERPARCLAAHRRRFAKAQKYRVRPVAEFQGCRDAAAVSAFDVDTRRSRNPRLRQTLAQTCDDADLAFRHRTGGPTPRHLTRGVSQWANDA